MASKAPSVEDTEELYSLLLAMAIAISLVSLCNSFCLLLKESATATS
jgi:hypothetical protein